MFATVLPSGSEDSVLDRVLVIWEDCRGSAEVRSSGAGVLPRSGNGIAALYES